MGDVFSMPIKSFKDNNNRNKHFLMRIAAWLIDNTALTFNQIAQCCGLALKEVQTIADEEIEVEEYNPIISGIITEKEIDDSEKNPNHIPKLIVKNIKKSHRITGNNIAICPTAKRRDKPDAVHFLTINFPELSNSMIAKLISTTNCTVEQIRDGSHHNMKNIIPRDPVLIGLCRQEDLNAEVEKVKVEKEKQERLKNIKNSY